LDDENALKLASQLDKGPTKVVIGSDEFEVTKEMAKFNKVKKTMKGKQVTPAVIEPSFGIGRILYSVLEHSYNCRESDEQRAVLSLPPAIAPVKISILPLVQDSQLNAFIPRISSILTDNGISFKVDDTGVSIGRRYARTDEIGIPFGLTIDHDTITTDTVTLRERDSTNQVRVKIDEVASVIQKLVRGVFTWAQVWNQFPKVEAKKED